MGSHGIAEVRMVERKTAAHGNGNGKGWKGGAAQIAELRKALEEVKGERDEVLARLTQVACDKDEALGTLAEVRAEVTALTNQNEVVVRDRDELAAEQLQAVALVAELSSSRKNEMESLINERDALQSEKEAEARKSAEQLLSISEEILSLKGARAQSEGEKLSLIAQTEELRASYEAEITALQEARKIAIRERDEALLEMKDCDGNLYRQIETLRHERDQAVADREAAIAASSRITTAQKEQIASVAGERDALARKKVQLAEKMAAEKQSAEEQLQALIGQRDRIVGENDAMMTELSRVIDAQKSQIESLSRHHAEMVGERDAALERMHALSDELAEAQRQESAARHDAELRCVTERQQVAAQFETAHATLDRELAAEKKERDTVRREPDEALARLERLKESEKLQSEKLARESLDLVEERDRAVVRLQKAREEFEQSEKQFEKTQEYLVREKDKAFALLNEARQSQQEIERAFDQVAPVLRDLAGAEEALHPVADGEPSGREIVTRMDADLVQLQAGLNVAREKAGEVSRLKSFELSPAEKLLTRHKYELVGEMATGQPFVQVRAKDLNIDRVVQMKIVAADTGAREEGLGQLVAEAQIIGRLEHPNIQPLYELSIDETGRAFYTAKLLTGSSLAKILEDLRARKSSAIVNFDLRRLLMILNGVCDALAFAHEAGIAHGRLTAEEVNVGIFGEVIVTGWEGAGIIRQEQIEAYEEDLRPDIAALGNLLYHILTLTPPVPGESKVGKLHAGWKVPGGLWRLTRRLRSKRGVSAYPRVKQIQMEIDDFRQDLGPHGGRATALEKVQHYLHKWQ